MSDLVQRPVAWAFRQKTLPGPWLPCSQEYAEKITASHPTSLLAECEVRALYAADALESQAAEIERLRKLLEDALPMLENYHEFTLAAPFWHCTGHENNVLNFLLPKIRAAIDAAKEKT